ncbi:MAG TPA: major capsid protein [Limnobacter sp.]|nr:major capsid protein [Limnobacter sp.]
MSTVRLSDIIEPAVFLDYQAKDTMALTAFWQSGVIVTSPELVNKANSGGKIVDVPFWKDLADSEPNYSTDDPAQTSTPAKISTGDQIARIAYLNKSWSATDLASEIAGSNAMQRIAARTDAWWARQYQARLIACTVGLYNDNVAANSGDMVFNAARQTAGAAAVENGFTRANFTSAAFTLGDAFENTGAIAVHSVIYKRMIDNDDIDFIVDSAGTMQIPTFLGRRVIIDDGMPVALNATSGLLEYTSILFGAGAIGYGEGSPVVPVEVDRDPEQGNGGGVETLYIRKTMLMHPFGYQFTSSSVAGVSPTLAELRNAANWTRVFDERKQVPVAFLVTN